VAYRTKLSFSFNESESVTDYTLWAAKKILLANLSKKSTLLECFRLVPQVKGKLEDQPWRVRDSAAQRKLRSVWNGRMDRLFRVPPLDKTVLLTLSHSAQPPNSCKKTIHLTWLGTYAQPYPGEERTLQWWFHWNWVQLGNGRFPKENRSKTRQVNTHRSNTRISDHSAHPLQWSEVKSLSHIRLFATLWTVAHQAPLSMGFSRQEYWSGLPFPSPGDLPDPGIELSSPTLQADALTSVLDYNPVMFLKPSHLFKTTFPLYLMVPDFGISGGSNFYNSFISLFLLKFVSCYFQFAWFGYFQFTYLTTFNFLASYTWLWTKKWKNQAC